MGRRSSAYLVGALPPPSRRSMYLRPKVCPPCSSAICLVHAAVACTCLFLPVLGLRLLVGSFVFSLKMPRVRARRSVRSASCGQQPANEASPSSLAELKELSVQVLRLRCEQAHMVSSGSKTALVDRLAEHFSLADGRRVTMSRCALASLASQVAQLQRQLAASSHEAGSRKTAPHLPPPQEPPLLDLRVSSPGPLALSPARPAPVVNASPDGFAAGTAPGLSSRTTEAIFKGALRLRPGWTAMRPSGHALCPWRSHCDHDQAWWSFCARFPRI